MHFSRRLMAAAIAAFLGFSLPALSSAQPDQVRKVYLQVGEDGHYDVPLYKAGVIEMPRPVKRISVGNPGIADILLLRSKELYVLGKALGTTNIVLWDNEDRIFATLMVQVTHDLDSLKVRLHQLLPDEKIKVHSAQERIILSGQVSSLDKLNAAKELATSFLPKCVAPESNILVRDTTSGTPVVMEQGGGKRSGGNQECKGGTVVNLMTVGGVQQVMLELKVAEISRDALKKMDVDLNVIRFDSPWTLGAVNGGASFPNALNPAGLEVPVFGNLGEFPVRHGVVGPAIDKFEPNIPTISDTGAFFSYLSSQYYVQAAIDASRRKGLAKVLAEPTLTALTGQEAQFLSGGEFPVPVPQSNTGSVTIEYKEFGVGVRFLPVVIDSGRINLKLNVAVSELSSQQNVVMAVPNTSSTFVIPSLTKRSAGTTVELADGQTIGIAGLISDNVREFVDKFPGLGDIPILGTLFRSQEFMSGQTELVVFVTPHLARPISPQDVRLPTDSFVPPGDLDFYILGQMEGRRTEGASAEGTSEQSERGVAEAGPESGNFGQQL